ncbi:MAG TPA: Uma2 family endonuclease, partial [Aquifex sp.]|nr:Uma2 family endonuclease [Aquifex sp.]
FSSIAREINLKVPTFGGFGANYPFRGWKTPDIAVVCDHEGDKITKPPKVVIEVVSPSTKKVDEEIKPLIYAREGVKYPLPVYPEREKMVCLVPKGERYEGIPCGEEIEISPKGDCGLKLSAKGVWERV